MTIKYTKQEVIKFTIINYLSLTLSVGVIVNLVFKTYYGRPRPRQFVINVNMYRDFWQPNWHESELDNSFPSGHTAAAWFCFVWIALLANKRWPAILCGLWAWGVGISRVYLFQHFPVDVAFGAFIGISSSSIFYYLYHETIAA